MIDDTNRKNIRKRKRRILRRLKRRVPSHGKTVLAKRRPRYEVSDRTSATKVGGLGAVHALILRLKLAREIDDRLTLLKRHQPYFESDHVLSLAYNIIAGGKCLQDLDLLRQDEALMDMLGADRLPDPTTAGDFSRRFKEQNIYELMDLVNDTRTKLWELQPKRFRREAVVDIDGTVAGTYGEKKEGMERNLHKKLWGYHPLLVSLANTREPLYLINRPGNVTSHNGAAEIIDKSIELLSPTFDSILLRGDTDFSLTVNFDRWTSQGVRFVFGYDAMPNMVALANQVADRGWRRFARKDKHKGDSRREKRENVKEAIVEKRGWKNLVLQSEDITEIEYQPKKCSLNYRVIILRKRILEKKGQKELFEHFRYFFYVTNDVELTAEEVIKESNDRCDQENLIAELKGGIGAMRLPVHDLLSNWAYMVIASLAWTFKAWFGLTLPKRKDRREVVAMEFRRFLNWIILIPAQVLKTGRQIVIRLLGYSEKIRLLFKSLAESKALEFT
ncbi:MAG: IS1380 family transposase [Planctomycetota bacterium]|nr:IS1380 family transposase [Planctomycetota bacterium]